jgi:hypothetical protein
MYSRGSQHSMLFPSPRGCQRGYGGDSDPTNPFQAPHQFEILHYWQIFEPTHAAKQIGLNKNGLISIRDLQFPRSEVG